MFLCLEEGISAADLEEIPGDAYGLQVQLSTSTSVRVWVKSRKNAASQDSYIHIFRICGVPRKSLWSQVRWSPDDVEREKEFK